MDNETADDGARSLRDMYDRDGARSLRDMYDRDGACPAS